MIHSSQYLRHQSAAQKDAGVGLSWLDQVKAYERDVLLAR